MADEINLSRGDEPIPTVRLTETGTVGLSVTDGRVDEAIRKELTWPHSIKTYKNMANDPLISAAINLMENMITKVDWVVNPYSDEQEDIDKAKYILQNMGDMEHTWEEFIREMLSYIVYGFCVNEKVFRYRDKESGSKYSDNLIGWRKLPVRSQDTIEQWKWSQDGRRLLGVYQDISRVSNDTGRYTNFLKGNTDPKGKFVRRDKFLLTRYSPKRDNPLGNSPLNACWLPYKFRTVIEEQEAIGIARDLKGMPVLGLHPKYMSPDASPEDASVYEYYKGVMRNIQANEQGTLIYPLMYNDSGKKIIEFELMSSSGSKSYDTGAIIKRYDDKILTALFADILKLGQDSHGSFSLAGAKTSIVAVNIEARLKEIKTVINDDLVKQTFELNGWDTSRLPEITYQDLDEEDLDEFSKLVQRIAAVGFLPKSRELVSQVVKRAGFSGWEDILDLSDEEFDELFPEATSRSGDGMKEGINNGTGGGTVNKDSSSSNKENA